MEKNLHTSEYVLSRSLGHVIRAVHYAENEGVTVTPESLLCGLSHTAESQLFRLVFD